MNKTIQDKIRELMRLPSSELGRKAKLAMDWLKDKIRLTASKDKPKIGDLNTREALLQQKERLRTQTFIGEMYFFVYDPKWKKVLPYYDKFPMVFPIEMYDDGFLGLNLHYLDIRNRMILLDHLTSLKNNNKYDHSTRLKLSYQAVKGMSEYVKPCVKRYLYNHVRSKFIRVDASEWDIALYLPVHDFEKAISSRVWRESRKKAMRR